MYIVTESFGIGYTVLDTCDGVAEFCTVAQLEQLLQEGVEIFGISRQVLKVGGLVPVVLQWQYYGVWLQYNGLVLKKKTKLDAQVAQIINISSRYEYDAVLGAVRKLNSALGLYEFPPAVPYWRFSGSKYVNGVNKVGLLRVDECDCCVPTYLDIFGVFVECLCGHGIADLTIHSYDVISFRGYFKLLATDIIRPMLSKAERLKVTVNDSSDMDLEKLKTYLGGDTHKKTAIFGLPIYNLHDFAHRCAFGSDMEFPARFDGIRDGVLYADGKELKVQTAVQRVYAMEYASDADRQALLRYLNGYRARKVIMGQEYLCSGWDDLITNSWELNGESAKDCDRKVRYYDDYRFDSFIKTPWGCINIISTRKVGAECIFLNRVKNLKYGLEYIKLDEMQVVAYSSLELVGDVLYNDVRDSAYGLQDMLTRNNLGYYLDTIYPIGVKDVQLRGDGIMISILCLVASISNFSWSASSGYSAAVIPLLFTGCKSIVYNDYWCVETLCHDIYMPESVVKHLVGSKEDMAETGNLFLEAGKHKYLYMHQEIMNSRLQATLEQGALGLL